MNLAGGNTRQNVGQDKQPSHVGESSRTLDPNGTGEVRP